MTDADRDHLATLEARLDAGETYEAMLRDGRISAAAVNAGLVVGVRMQGGVRYKDLPIPVSRSMPRDMRPGRAVNYYGVTVREHDDGTLSTMSGRRIVDSAQARLRHMAQCGYFVYDD